MCVYGRVPMWVCSMYVNNNNNNNNYLYNYTIYNNNIKYLVN